MTKDLAQSYVYDAYNDADHADSLVQSARVALENDDLDEALEMLIRAATPAERLVRRVRSAIDVVRELKAGNGEDR